ncbi:unnamed protein product [Adineta steineri]|uniref:Pyrroloquinoline quinone-dependent pyranose dehydrogenase beta-propeller domain-containing protein n=1 Tax=Adineta steineri TaxID=433720 RepID=A0A818TL51_9BILA|nr:unnamed protein product [Adineta steineri]CAF3686132.1 unnamed protein product [Adineta steineri]
MFIFLFLLGFSPCLSITKDVQIVPIKLFIPKPIRITVNDLPPPYHTESAQKAPSIVPIPQDAKLFVPDLNFRVSVYRDNLKEPRQMIYTPKGDILVTEMHGNRISILTDDDTTAVFADESNGISNAFGMAFIKGWFYVANSGDLRRYAYKMSDKRLQGTGEIIMTYENSHHWTRSLIISPNNDQLYVTIGSGSNVDIEYPPRASVQVAKLNGSNNETYAWGLRNPVGIDFHPKTGDLYVTVQERDHIGDDLVPDYFTRIKKDEFYGWPFAYLSSKNIDPRRRILNGSSERPDLVERTRTPDVLFQSHSSVLGMQFYRGKQFPNYYRNGAFAAFHGSWNRDIGVGFNLVFIPFGNDNRPKGYYEEFLRGFMIDSKGPKTFGRPVGILEMKDGSLLFSEDGNGRLYRIEYITKESKVMPIVSNAKTIIVDKIFLLFFISCSVFFL